jgi:outer membrane protein, multidrug efflux system
MLNKFTLFISFIFAAFVLLLQTGCEVGPAYKSPVSEIPVTWKTEQSQAPVNETVCHWWEIFHDETLNGLIHRAIEGNPNIYAAVQRVIQARAIAGIAKADLYPQIVLNPNYSNQKFLTEVYGANVINNLTGAGINNQNIPLFREHLQAYNLPLNLSWEIDLWGRLKNIYKSAVYSADAEYDDFRNLLLIITTDLADSYFQLRTIDTQTDLYLATIKTRKKALELNQDRYESKLIDYVAVSQATLDLANVEADYYDSIRQRIKAVNCIATLIGIPASELVLDHNPLKEDPPVIPAGIPSEVLSQRPDIAEAERQRASEQALVKSAYASFLPSLSLTGAVGFSSPDLRHFLSWKSRFWDVGASSVQTVIDGGRKLSNLELQWAKFRELDQDYQQRVLVAFQEVEDALADTELYYKESGKLNIAVKAAAKTYKLVFDRYYQGIDFYLSVVDSERDLLDAERINNSVLGLRYSATIQLIKALGGSWSAPEAEADEADYHVLPQAATSNRMNSPAEPLPLNTLNVLKSTNIARA